MTQIKSFSQLKKYIDVLSKSNANSLLKIEKIKQFQRSNLETNRSHTVSFTKYSINQELKFQIVSNDTIDKYLLDILQKDLLRQKPSGVDDENKVIHSYLTITPVPSQSNILEILKDQPSLRLLNTALSLLIYKHKDIKACLSLIQQNAHTLQKLRKRQLLRNNTIKLGLLGLLNVFLCHPLAINISTCLLGDLYLLNFMLLKFFIIDPRFLYDHESYSIEWRPGTNTLYKITNLYNFQLLSRIVRISNEVYYLNVSNYNLQNSNLMKSFEDHYDEELETVLTKSLRTQGLMRKRHHEETIFQEYWENAGDGFDWVEGDKDPIEFIHIKDR